MGTNLTFGEETRKQDIFCVCLLKGKGRMLFVKDLPIQVARTRVTKRDTGDNLFTDDLMTGELYSHDLLDRNEKDRKDSWVIGDYLYIRRKEYTNVIRIKYSYVELIKEKSKIYGNFSKISTTRYMWQNLKYTFNYDDLTVTEKSEKQILETGKEKSKNIIDKVLNILIEFKEVRLLENTKPLKESFMFTVQDMLNLETKCESYYNKLNEAYISFKNPAECIEEIANYVPKFSTISIKKELIDYYNVTYKRLSCIVSKKDEYLKEINSFLENNKINKSTYDYLLSEIDLVTQKEYTESEFFDFCISYTYNLYNIIYLDKLAEEFIRVGMSSIKVV